MQSKKTTYCVYDGVNRSHFVKMHILNGSPMHCGFGLSKEMECEFTTCDYRWRQRRRIQETRNSGNITIGGRVGVDGGIEQGTRLGSIIPIAASIGVPRGATGVGPMPMTVPMGVGVRRLVSISVYVSMAM